jgi:radical SAM superfamily enzyme YgiQ (UPF0313 family)
MAGVCVKILLCQDMHETSARPVTPVALLDLAAYYRSLGHNVVCSYCGPVSGHYDLIGLSALSPSPESLLSNLTALRPHCDRLVLGGKVTHRLRDAERRQIEQVAEIHRGPGETLFGDNYTLDGYPAWLLSDLQSMKYCDGSLMSSRGCPYRCNFCHNTETIVRRFSPERTAANVSVMRHFGKTRFHILDDVFGLSVSHGRKIYDALSSLGEPIDGNFRFFCHVKHVPAAIALITLFRPNRVSLGIESGCDATLAAMNKGFTSGDALDAVKTIYNETKVNIDTMFILGYPGESRKQLAETVALASSLKPYVQHFHASFYQPVVGTVGHDAAMQRNPNMADGRCNAQISWIDPLLRKCDLVDAMDAFLKLNNNRADVLD